MQVFLCSKYKIIVTRAYVVNKLSWRSRVLCVFFSSAFWNVIKTFLFHAGVPNKDFSLCFKSLISYFCSWFRTKDTAEPRWLLKLMQCWFLLILWPKEVVTMFLVFWFVPLSLSYDPKCEGHPFKVKGITEILSWS